MINPDGLGFFKFNRNQNGLKNPFHFIHFYFYFSRYVEHLPSMMSERAVTIDNKCFDLRSAAALLSESCRRGWSSDRSQLRIGQQAMWSIFIHDLNRPIAKSKWVGSPENGHIETILRSWCYQDTAMQERTDAERCFMGCQGLEKAHVQMFQWK